MASILGIILSIGGLVCWIITLIKMFQKDNVGLAILGIICPLWAFIWGWLNAAKHDHKKIMMIWTACWILSMIFTAAGGGFSSSFSVGQ